MKEVLWGLSLGFGVAGGIVAAIGVPLLAYYFPLGLGAAGLALAIAAATAAGESSPWWAVVAVIGSLAGLGVGIDGYNEFSDTSQGLNDVLGR